MFLIFPLLIMKCLVEIHKYIYICVRLNVYNYTSLLILNLIVYTARVQKLVRVFVAIEFSATHTGMFAGMRVLL